MFDDCGMVGTLPDNLFDSFPNLNHLHLSAAPPNWNWVGPQYPRAKVGNHFTGPLPSSLGRVKLQWFLSQWNSFSGPVPQSLVDYIENSSNLMQVCSSAAPCDFWFGGNCLTNLPVSPSPSVLVSAQDTQRSLDSNAQCLEENMNNSSATALSIASTTAAVMSSVTKSDNGPSTSVRGSTAASAARPLSMSATSQVTLATQTAKSSGSDSGTTASTVLLAVALLSTLL
ncbi:hypothetical protein BC830DRAFT_1171399 [Chytriomyces sp. MP71]|nr:hypothetical protein BC830DRAFT_1171399 [Chytriomyces sp. MP71]